MDNNTVMSKESDSGGNKRKRSLKENEGKANQKKTLWSYFHSSKNDGSENLNETEVKPKISVSEGQASEKKSNENGDLGGSVEIVEEKVEHKKNIQETSQSAFEKSPISETEVKSETSNENQASTVKTSETEEPQDNVENLNEMKEPEPEKANKESFQMASTLAIDDEKSENLNETGVKPEIFISESQELASKSPEKSSENEEPQDNVKSLDDNKEQEETNQENLQMDSAVNGAENLNETEVKPGTSSEDEDNQDHMESEVENNEDHMENEDEDNQDHMESEDEDNQDHMEGEDEDNQDNMESEDETEEPEKTNEESSQATLKPAYSDWRSGCYSISCLSKKARKEGLFADIQFVMGEGDKRKEFHAHKSILACASPVFEEMFFGPLPEERSVIETDDDPEAFEMLLDYIYGTSCFIRSANSLTSICKFSIIGSKYLIPRIQKMIKSRISTIDITQTDFWDVFQASNFNSLCPLFRDKLDSYIMENANALVQSENFLNMPETIVHDILQMNKLNIEEYPLLIAVTKWVYHNKDQVTSKTLIEYYKHIRFFTIGKDDFIQFIDSYPEALDAGTCIKILKHIHHPYNFERDLPEWCTKKRTSRKEEYEDSIHGPRCTCYRCY